MNRMLILGALVACTFAVASPSSAEAASGYRQYYSSWSHRPTHKYHYTRYYYKPTPTYRTYNYHYCIHYPSRPRYVYYYNPVKRRYWGRFDTKGKKGAQYSLLAEKDRKENLKDIPEKAFPKPGEMPVIPESSDKVQIAPIKSLPKSDVDPDDLP